MDIILLGARHKGLSFGETAIINLLHPKGCAKLKWKRYEKSPLNFSRLVRYLADSNRRPRFCRPIPNHSGKVPFCGCKDTSFWRTARFFCEIFTPSPVLIVSASSTLSRRRRAHRSIYKRFSSLYDADVSSRKRPSQLIKVWLAHDNVPYSRQKRT